MRCWVAVFSGCFFVFLFFFNVRTDWMFLCEGVEVGSLLLTLLGPQSRFGDKLLEI